MYNKDAQEGKVMKKKSFAALGMAMLVGISTITAYAEAPEEKVKNIADELYVSPLGSDENGDGSKTKPYQTLQKTQEVVSEKVKAGLSSNLNVNLMEGTYYLDSPIEIGSEDCDDTYRITYKNCDGENARVLGGHPVTGWNDSDKDGIYEADITGRTDLYSLFADGTRLTNAKEASWQNIAVKDQSHMQAVYGGSTSWFGEILKVSSVEGSNVKTELSKGSMSGNLQYLQGAKEYINEPGEWAVEENTLYYKPLEGTDPINSEIIAPTVDRIFYLKGTEDNLVKNITIDGLDLEMTAFGDSLLAHSGRYGSQERTEECPVNLKGIVDFDNTTNVTVSNCILKNGGYMAVMLNHYSQGNTVYGNDIEDTGYAGIFMIGEDPGSLNYINKNNTISNNKIRNVGHFVSHGSGIYLMNSGENTITHNNISDTPRYGISMKGIRYGVFKDNYLTDVPFEDHWKYNQTTGNYIGYNTIFDTGKDSGDGGGIESWGIGRDNWIDHNIVYNAYRGKPNGGWRGHSIFGDDGSHYLMATNNIVYDESAVTVNAGIMMKSINSYAVNNIFDIGYADHGSADMEPYIEPCSDMVFENNIVYSNTPGKVNKDGTYDKDGSGERTYMKVIDHASMPVMEAFKSLDNNMYYNGKGEGKILALNKFLSLDEWKNFDKNTNGYDKNSVETDPKFVNADNRDYRLTADSPAREIGITGIDMGDIGLLADYRYGDAGDTPKQLFLKFADRPEVVATAAVGEELKSTVLVRTENGYAVTNPEGTTFSGDNESVATVSKDGTVTTKADGTVVITATNGDLKDTYTLYVGESASELIAKNLELTMGKDEIECIDVKAKTNSGHYVKPSQITYTSNDESVVSVDEKGFVKAQAKGTTTITIDALVDGKNLSKDITVYVGKETIPGKIEAENYRDMSGIEKEVCDDENGGQNITAKQGDWAEYSVEVKKASTYNVNFRVNIPDGKKAEFDFLIGGKVIKTVNLDSTAGKWETVTQTMDIPKGSQTMRIAAKTGNWKLNWMDVEYRGQEVPGRIEAESFDNQYNVKIENGATVGYIEDGSWMEYKIFVNEPGKYNIKYRVSVNASEGKVEFIAGEKVLKTTILPGTGGWQNWVDVTDTLEFTDKGEYTVRLNVLKGKWNIDYFDLYKDGSVIGARDPYESTAGDTANAYKNGANKQNGKAGLDSDGAYVMFEDMNFKEGAKRLTAIYETGNLNRVGDIELRLDGTQGQVIGTIDCEVSGAWGITRQSWIEVDPEVVKGVHDLYVIAKPGALNLVKLQFSQNAAGTGDISGLEVAGEDLVTAPEQGISEYQFTANCLDDLNQRAETKDVVWSLESADENIKINEETGMLSVGVPKERETRVTLNAKFKADQTISAQKEITIYDGVVQELAGNQADEKVNIEPDGISGVAFMQADSYLTYNDIDFGNGVEKYRVKYSCPKANDLKLQTDTEEDAFSSVEVNSGSWSNYVEKEQTVENSPTGIQNLILTQNDSLHFHWIRLYIPRERVMQTEYAVNIIENIPNGRVTADKMTAKAGERVTLTVDADEGYELKKESLKVTDMNGAEVSLEGNSFIMPESDVDVTAEFQISEVKKYSLSIDPEIVNGTIGLDKLEAAAEELITMTVLPDEGYVLKEGSLQVNGGEVEVNDLQFVMPEKEVLITAEFEKVEQPKFQIQLDGGITHGIVVADRNEAKAGETVTLQVMPEEGYVLKEGSLQVNGGDVEVRNLQFTMPEKEVLITAEFEKAEEPTFQIQLDDGIVHGTVVADRNEAKAGETVTLQITPEKGYILKEGSLQVNSGEVEVKNLQFMMPVKDVVITAEFVKMETNGGDETPTVPDKPDKPDNNKGNGASNQKDAEKNLNNNSSVKTGDETNVFGLVLLIIAAGGIIVRMQTRRKA